MSSEEGVDGRVFSAVWRRAEHEWYISTYENSTSEVEGQKFLQNIKENVSKIQQEYPHVTLESLQLFDYKVKRDSTNRVILHQARVQARDIMLSVEINTKGHMIFRQIPSLSSHIHTHPNRITYHTGLLSQIETINLTPGEDWNRYDTSKPDTDGKQVLSLINVYRTKIQRTLQIEHVDPQLQWYWNISRDDYDSIVSCEAIVKASTGDSNNYYVMISENGLKIKLIATPLRHAQKHALSHALKHANMVQTENCETLGFLSVEEDIMTTNVVHCLDLN